jgi:hypothetical protein
VTGLGLTREQAVSLTGTLEIELMMRGSAVMLADDYYRGLHPLRFASEEFREYFARRYAGFSDNWVPVVADSPVERLTVTGFQPYESDPDKEAWRVWQVNNLDCDSQLGFLGAILGGRSYVLVWGDPDNPDTPCVTFEDAGQAIVLYYPGTRYRRRAALKRWQDGYKMYATLYTADELWKFERPLTRVEKPMMIAQADEQADEWLDRVTDEPNPQPNPMGVVPMVELPNRPVLVREPLSDVAPVIPLQDAVNLLWAQLFTASDFAALPQRYILGADRPTMPVYDAAGKKTGEKEVDLKDLNLRRLFWVEGEGASAGSWPAANLEVYSAVIETAIGHLAAQTRTPQHYLIGKMANLSSDALIAAEVGLVKRTMEKQLWFGQALREVQRLVALAQGNTGKAKAYQAGKVLWADVESRSQSQLVAALVQLKAIGWPFEDLARRYGLTPDDVAQLLQMREREVEQDPILAMLGTKELGNSGIAGKTPDPALLDDAGIPAAPTPTPQPQPANVRPSAGG